MNRPKIAIMLPKLSHYGGVEGFAWRLAEALGQEYDVDYICTRQETDPPDGVTVRCIGRPFLGKCVKILWFALGAEFVRRKSNYDLAIGLGNTICQDILRISGGPTRVFWQHSIQAYPQGFARTWKMTKRRLSLANNLVLVIEKLQMRFSGQIIANSHLVQDWLFEAFPHLNQHRVTVIYNQPDLNRFAPCTLSQKQSARVKWDIPPDTQVIATAGTNFMLKGIRPLIATLTHLPEDTLLVVAGGRHPGRYIRYAQRCGVAHRVRFVGRVDDMISFYQASDLFVLLSFYDACSNAVLEALASGLPVVSTTTNGSSFFLPPEWTVDPGTDPSQLAQKMKRILAQNKPSSFTFPDHVPSGLDPYIAAVKASLTLKKTAGSIGSNDS